MMSPVPIVNKAYSTIASEESQRSLGMFSQAFDIGDGTILFTNRGMNTRNNYKPRRGNLLCDYCNHKGHTRETCFKLHGYPTDFKMRMRAVGFPQQPMDNATTQEGQHSVTQPMANAVSQQGQQMMNTTTGTVAHGIPIMFTQEQYDQILKLINKDPCENMKNFAGTTNISVIDDKTKGENQIVYSGATNHMVHTGELLDKINTNTLGNESKVYLPDGTLLDIACT